MILVRAICISTVVTTHMFLKWIPGGAHTLLTLMGYNFARFTLSATSLPQRLRAGARTVARVAVPAVAWIGINALVAGRYTLSNVLLVNNYMAEATAPPERFHYWFIEVFVQLTSVALIVMCIPFVASLERRRPIVFAWALLVPLLLVRFEVVRWGDMSHYLFRTHTTAWFFVVGWLMYRSTTITHRLTVSLLIVATVPGFFAGTDRVVYVIAALLAVIWIPKVPMPYLAQRIIGAIASASMWIYLVHWQVFPPLTRLLDRRLAYVATLAVGLAVWWLTAQVQRQVMSAVRQRVGTAAHAPSPGRERSAAATGQA